MDCDFPANLTRNFTNLFWLHEQDQSPPRLVAWHLTSSFQNDSGSIGSRFQSIFDLENHRSRLTITGLEEEDGGWYQCEGLGELSGRQRGTRTNLAVKGELVFWDLVGQAKSFCSGKSLHFTVSLIHGLNLLGA